LNGKGFFFVKKEKEFFKKLKGISGVLRSNVKKSEGTPLVKTEICGAGT
jgi:hypothetical protein